MEKKIFIALDFKVYGYPSPFEFAQRLSTINEISETELYQSIFFCLLAMISDEFLEEKPSIIAFISVKLAL